MDALAHLRSYDAAETATLLPFGALVDRLREAAAQYAAGQIVSPERMVTRLGDRGLMLSMPSTAKDIACHKLVNVCPDNKTMGLPTIHGLVTVFDPDTGAPLFVLDGPTVSARRTAAVSMLAITTLMGNPRDALLIGTGSQAACHVEALADLHPDTRVFVRGSSPSSAERFVETHRRISTRMHVADREEMPDDLDLVLTLTTSKTPVYREEARAGRLVIGVGAFTPDAAEVDPITIGGSMLVVDDPVGARHEAGDLIQAGVNWSHVASLADIVAAAPPPDRPVFFKSVGCAAWDLAACRVAKGRLSSRGWSLRRDGPEE